MTGSHASPLEIIALGNAELAEASRWFGLSRRMQSVPIVAGVVAVFVSDTASYLGAVVAALAQACVWLSRRHASNLQSTGDEARRRGLLLDALGPTTEPMDIALLLSHLSKKAHSNIQALEDPNYFASEVAPGAVRLREHLQENAFWAKCQYDAVVRRYWALFAVYAGVALILGLVLVPLTPDEVSVVAARVLVTMFSFTAAVTQLNEVLAWRSAAQKVEILDRRLETLVARDDHELRADRLESMLAVFADYCIATAMAPPVPPKVYEQDRDRLNSLWEDRRARQPG